MPDPQAESTFAASRLSWSWEVGPTSVGTAAAVSRFAAGTTRMAGPARYINRTARLLPTAGPVLELTRGKSATDSASSIRALFNLSAQEQPIPDGDSGRLLWSSEAERYHGARRADLPIASCCHTNASSLTHSINVG